MSSERLSSTEGQEAADARLSSPGTRTLIARCQGVSLHGGPGLRRARGHFFREADGMIGM